MRTSVISLLILLIVANFQLKALEPIINYGDFPQNRLSANTWQYFEWDSTGVWETIDVTTRGITPGSTVDIGPLVNAIIESGSNKRILKFPAGTYQIKTSINISKSDIQIIGEGSTTRFMLVGGANPSKIFCNGSRTGEDYRLSVDAKRGDGVATFTSASAFNVGDYFIIYQAGSVTRAGASGDETQIFKVLAKSGNTLTLDMKFGIPFNAANARIERIGYKRNIKLHNFYIEMTTVPTVDATSIVFNVVQNVEISKIESNKNLVGHITVFRGREVVIRDNNVYGNYGKNTSGGYQYGYTFNFSTHCMMINNRTANLRHHYVTQFGTNHCIIAYNRAEAPYNHYADLGQHNSKGCHNNLWEGNFGSEIFDDPNPLKSWGTRYTMWFRNHALSKVGSENEYVENMNIIANELKGGTDAIKKGAPGKYTFSGANIVNINSEGGTGTIIWDNLPVNAKLPPSMFLDTKPTYVKRWPLYGPGTVTTTGVTKLAEEKKISIYPNPVTNKNFSVKYNNISVRSIAIKSINGMEVYKNKVTPNTSVLIIENNFANGMYIVLITDENNKIYSDKLIIR